MKKHKHAEIIKAWADGAEIEYRHGHMDGWNSLEVCPKWFDFVEYRIKPAEPKMEKRLAWLDDCGYVRLFHENMTKQLTNGAVMFRLPHLDCEVEVKE